MTLLWAAILIPIGLITLGAFMFSLNGEEDKLFPGLKPRQLAEGFFTLTAAGTVGTILLGIVFTPALLLFFVCHRPYGASACIGLPLGFVPLILFVWHAERTSSDETSQTPEL